MASTCFGWLRCTWHVCCHFFLALLSTDTAAQSGIVSVDSAVRRLIYHTDLFSTLIRSVVCELLWRAFSVMENVSVSVAEEALCAHFADGSEALISAHHIARSNLLQQAVSAAPCDRPFTIEVPPRCLQLWLHAVAATDVMLWSPENIVLALKVRLRLEACFRHCLGRVRKTRRGPSSVRCHTSNRNV
jgi:hypothetical protein